MDRCLLSARRRIRGVFPGRIRARLFAARSLFRPNPIGLDVSFTVDGDVLRVTGIERL